jgi:hypothetical protein
MSDQGFPMPEQAQPAPPSTEDELVKAIEATARGAQIATGSTAAEESWHFGQAAFYFAQALKLLVAPADPAAAQAAAQPEQAAPASPQS